jgi:hypothetical protein
MEELVNELSLLSISTIIFWLLFSFFVSVLATKKYKFILFISTFIVSTILSYIMGTITAFIFILSISIFIAWVINSEDKESEKNKKE